MAGHNKWSKIKRKKALADAKKSRIFSRYARLITVEARSASGNLHAPGLLATVERAKRDGMPKDTIERAITKGIQSTDRGLLEVIFEAFGPGGTALIITAVTDNNNRTSQTVRQVLTRAGYTLGTPGCALWAFTKTSTGYRPLTPTTRSEADCLSLLTIREELLNLDDVEAVFTSIDAE